MNRYSNMGKRKYDTDIPIKVKEAVFERDKRRCIYCHKNNGIPNAHYIRRSQGGLGIEQNIVTLCPDCHKQYDNGNKREELEEYIGEYLKFKYGQNWSKEKLIYNKKKRGECNYEGNNLF